MTRSFFQRFQRCALVVGAAAGVFGTPAAARAQKALVYCPVSIDATGCNAIVTALTGSAYPLGVDRGYDGTNGTVDLKTVDLFAYSVFVVPSLADGSTLQPYAKLRDAEVVEHLKAALIGRIAMWSGTPDQGATNRALKDALIQNLAAWAGGAFQTAKGPGLVTLLDASSSVVARYDWVRAITPVPVTADANLLIYDGARALDSRGTGILTSSSGAIAYTNLATFGFQVPNGAPGVSLDAVGQTGTSQGGQVILLTVDAGNTGSAVVRTDKDDYAPGQTVTITGSGWQAGETVKLTLHMDPLRASDTELTATADGNGNFTNTDFAPQQYDVGVRFVLTAVGQASGLRAQTTFTDGNANVIGKVVSSAGGSAISGATVTCTTGCNVGVLPATTNATGDYNLAVNFPGNGPVTLTISVSATGFQTASAQVTILNNQANVTQNFTLTPSAVATTTTITADNPDPSDPNEAVTVSFSVQAASGAASPTGLVTVSASGTETCTGALAGSGGGLATGSCSITLVGSGNRTLTANYSGASGFGGSTDTEAHTVRQATSTALASNANPSKSGQQVTFTATVTSGGNAVTTGAVTLVEGASCTTGTTLVAATNVDGNGKATFQLSNLLVGSHSLLACYGQTATFAASSGGVSQTVDKAATTTALASSQNPADVGQSVTFTATVTVTAPGAGTATGTVTFKDGTTTLGTGTLDGTGVATFTTNTLTVGSHNITAEYAGDTQRAGSTSAILAQSITQIATTTTLTAAPNPSVFGQSVTFTATVASGGGVPTGTVTFKEGSTTLGTGTLDATGKATFSTTTLAVGSHPITADYAGAGNFAPSTSAVVTQVVNQASSATAIASSANPSVFSQSVTFTATVTAVAPGAGTPTGSVTFTDGATSLGTVALVGGTASVTTSALTVGTHSITATYGADANFAGSASAALSQKVNPAPTTTALVSSKTPTVFGESVTFTATVTVDAPGVGTPTGSIEFRDGTTVLGTVTLAAGQAAFTTSTLSVASHSISAVYSGDASFATSTGSTTQVVEKAATTTTVSGTPNPSVFGQEVTFTATVAVEAPGTGTPTGSVDFFDGATPIGNVALTGLTATLKTSTLAVNTHAITAKYSGDNTFKTSTSSAFSQVVNGAPTATALTSNANPSVFGQPVQFKATVTVTAPGVGTPGGTVTFKDGTTDIGTGTLNAAGEATLTVSSLTVGGHSITAHYEGNASFLASTSAPVNQTVDKAATSSVVVSSLNPSIFGQSVTFTATVTPVAPGTGTPTGSVTFKDGATTLDTKPLAGGSATFATAALNAATHSITVVYSGDANFKYSTSDALSQEVKKAPTATSVATSKATTEFGESVTFTATVSVVAPGVGVPDGTVTFKDGSTSLGTGTLNNAGVASFSTTSLGVGGHTITAQYDGAANYESSNGNVSQTVIPAKTKTVVVTSKTPTVFGESVTFTATVSLDGLGTGTPTGSITFKDNGATLQTVPLTGDHAELTTAALSVGSHTIRGEYTSDNGNFATSYGQVAQTVNQAATTVALVSDVNPSVFGQQVTFAATISVTAPGAGTPTGTVTFKDGATSIGTGTVNGSSVATLAISSLSVASHPITAVYSGDGNFLGSTSGTVSQVVNKAATNSVVASSKNPSTFGESVTFTATVTAKAPGAGTPTGTVTFKDGATVLDSKPLSSGSATTSTSALIAATHSITVEYGGDGNFNQSTSDVLSQVVNKASTTTAVATSKAVTVFGESVTFTATVAVEAPGVGVPDGSVTFKDGATTLGTVALNASGVASIATASLAVGGPRPITAEYSGAANYKPSSGTVSQTVSQAATTVALASSVNPSVFGQQVTFTATISVTAPGAGTPTGTVTFKDGATSIGTGTVSGSGVATLAISSLSVASHPITAVYSGDVNFLGSTSGIVSQVVNKAATASAVASSKNPSTFGETVTFTATVTAKAPGAGTPSGTVTFKDGATTLGTGTLNGSGVATFATSTLTAVTHNITAAYVGDGSFEPSTSGVVYQNVNKFTATTAVTVTPSTQQYSDKVTFEATVTPDQVNGLAPATGVTFKVGSQTMGTATLALVNDQWKATLPNVALLESVAGQMAPGNRTVTAVFTGVNPNFTVPDATNSLKIEQEDARATYTGLLFVSTPSTSTNTATITLRATIQDITAAPPPADADPGDIRKATVKFVNRDAADALLCTATLGLVNAADTKTASASCDWAASMTSSDNSVHFTIGVIVEGYYTRNASDDDAVVTLAKPYTGFITGGGYLVNQASSGTYAGGNGLRSNFGFNVKNNKSGANLQGAVNIIIRSNGKVYQVKSNSITSMTATLANGSLAGTAQFSGKANLKDITNPLAPISISGNLTLNMTLTDNGEPGSTDKIGFTLWDGNTLVYSSNWSGAATIEQVLAGGNTQVR